MQYRAFFVAFTLLLASVAASVSAEPKLPANIVRSFDKAALNTPLKAKAPDYYYDERAIISPDGKYVARFTSGEGEEGFLTVYRRAGKKNVWAKRYAVSHRFEEVDTCMWVPKQPHHLLIGTWGDSQRSYLALWTGTGQTRYLKRGIQEFNRVDGYNVYGTSPDGRVLYYEHYIYNISGKDEGRDLVQTLTLPK